MKELYFSVDIEADGACPGLNSMLSLGCAVVDLERGGEIIETFSVNLETLPDAKPDEDTMNWWQRFPEAWKACRNNTKTPDAAMKEFDLWVRKLCAKHNATPVFVAYPAGFDFTFVYYYLHRFTGDSVFSFSALDIKSYANALLGGKFKSTIKRNFPKSWKSKKRHTHISVDDAIEQAETFIKIYNDANKRILETAAE